MKREYTKEQREEICQTVEKAMDLRGAYESELGAIESALGFMVDGLGELIDQCPLDLEDEDGFNEFIDLCFDNADEDDEEEA